MDCHPHFAVNQLHQQLFSFYFFFFSPLEVDRLLRVSKKSLLMVTPHPVQVEKKKKTVWKTPGESEGTKNENDTSQENSESFFLTQV